MKELTEIITIQITNISRIDDDEEQIVTSKRFKNLMQKTAIEKIVGYYCPDDIQYNHQQFLMEMNNKKKKSKKED